MDVADIKQRVSPLSAGLGVMRITDPERQAGRVREKKVDLSPHCKQTPLYLLSGLVMLALYPKQRGCNYGSLKNRHRSYVNPLAAGPD